jgi:hypothetical protein
MISVLRCRRCDPYLRSRRRLVDREDDLLRQIGRALPFVPDVYRRDMNTFGRNLRAVFDRRFDNITGRRPLDREVQRLRIAVGDAIGG